MPSSRRNRRRKQARPEAFRDPKALILVVCEGEITEPQYLDGFLRACRNPRVRIRIAGEHGVPKTLVETAKRYKREAELEAKRKRDDNLSYDAVWCVFDVDVHPGVPDAVQMARDNGIDLAISNPCFELWLLLHFRDSPGMQSPHRVQRMLKVHVPDYNKNVEFSTYSDGYKSAATRAERMDGAAESDGEPGRNPTTSVYKLTDLVRAE